MQTKVQRQGGPFDHEVQQMNDWSSESLEVNRQIERILNPSQSTKELLENEFEQKISEIEESLTSRSNFLTLFQHMLQQEISLNTIRDRQQQRTDQQSQRNDLVKNEDENQQPEQGVFLEVNSLIKPHSIESACPMSNRYSSDLDTYRTFSQDPVQQDHSYSNQKSSPMRTSQSSISLQPNHQVNYPKIDNRVFSCSTQTEIVSISNSMPLCKCHRLNNCHQSLNRLKKQTKSFREENNKLIYFVGEVFHFLKSFLLDEIFRKGLLSIVQTVEANYELKYQQKIAQIEKYHSQLQLNYEKQQEQLKKHLKQSFDQFPLKHSNLNSNISLGSTISMRSANNLLNTKNDCDHVSQFDNTIHIHNMKGLPISHGHSSQPTNPNPFFAMNSVKSSSITNFNSQEQQLISFKPFLPLKTSNPIINEAQNYSSSLIGPKNSFRSNISNQNDQKAFSSISIKPKPNISDKLQENKYEKNLSNQTQNHPLRQVYLNDHADQKQRKPFSKINPCKSKLFFKTKSLSNNQAHCATKQNQPPSQMQSSSLKIGQDIRQTLQRMKKNKFSLQLPSQLPSLCYQQNPPNSLQNNSLDFGSTYVTYDCSDFSYQGCTQSGKFNGKGKLHLKKLFIHYEGQFQNHQMHGKGTLKILIRSNQFNKIHERLIVTGNFYMNQLNGYGKISIQQDSPPEMKFPDARQKDKIQSQSLKSIQINNQIYINQSKSEVFTLWKANQLIGIV